MTDLSRRDRVSSSSDAFTWIKFGTGVLFVSQLLGCVHVTESVIGEQACENERSSFAWKTRQTKNRRKKNTRNYWITDQVAIQLRILRQPSRTRVVCPVYRHTHRSSCDQTTSGSITKGMKFAKVCLFSSF